MKKRRGPKLRPVEAVPCRSCGGPCRQPGAAVPAVTRAQQDRWLAQARTLDVVVEEPAAHNR